MFPPDAGPAIRGFKPKARKPKEATQPKEPQRRLGERRRRLRRRAVPLGVLALAAFIWGAITAMGSAEEDAATRFIEAWARQDFPAMHKELTPAAQEEYPVDKLQSAYLNAQTASTATAIDPGDSSESGDAIEVEVGVRTKLFDKVEDTIELPFEDEKIAWAPHLTFPGLEEGERVGRRLKLGNRAAIVTKDGTLLAEGQGDGRRSSIGSAAIDVTGEVGDPGPGLKTKVESDGYPGDQPTGVSGLELALNSRLAGTPGGELLAVPEGTPLPDVPQSVEGRVLAAADGEPGENVRTTIDPDLQELAVAALGDRSGGITVLDARDGSVRALAGQAYSSLQPPGSTFKVITATAGLEEGKVKLGDVFDPVESINPSPQTGAAVIENAHDESCGGDFTATFAESCNTVFAPLGVEVGEEKLIEMAEKYGFNEEPTLYNDEATEAAQPGKMSIPTELDDPSKTELAASALGQGRVLATTLGMASVAQAVANGGVRSPTPIVVDPELRSDAEPVQVTSKENARIMASLMRAVVTSGTGSQAALPNVQVAGKTGTAELGPDPDAPPPKDPEDDPKQIVDAWFIAFAPANKPKLAVAVMLVDADGDGGEVAAPIARQILGSALGSG